MADKPDKQEYPHWIYPPDGGPGKLIHSPEEEVHGWKDHPSEAGAAEGERVIGDGKPRGPKNHTAEVVSSPPPASESPFATDKAVKKAK